MGGLVTRCTNVISKALHSSLDFATSCHRLPSPTLLVTTAWIGASNQRLTPSRCPRFSLVRVGSDARRFTARSVRQLGAGRIWGSALQFFGEVQGDVRTSPQ